MSPSELEVMLLENPNDAHRLTLASGDQVVVPNARSVSIENISLRVITFVGEDRLAVKSSRMVSIPNIVLAERIERRPPVRGRRP